MKYRLLKNIDNEDGEEILIGSTFEIDGDNLVLSNNGKINTNWLINNGYIEICKGNKKGDTNILNINKQITRNKESIKRLAKEQKILKYTKKILLKK